MRSSGVRGFLIYCSDYHCSHWTAINGDRRPDDIRLSDLEAAVFCDQIFDGCVGRCNCGHSFKIKLSRSLRKDLDCVLFGYGWSGALAYHKAAASLPNLILALIAAVGGLYTLGVLFHSWQRLRFQNAIRHGFVIPGAGCHFAAVVGLVPLKSLAQTDAIRR
jgi:hypothetical protein